MPRWSKTCVVAYKPFYPLDFIVIDFMQVNDCEGGRKEGATQMKGRRDVDDVL